MVVTLAIEIYLITHRYDLALGINVLGAKHILEFAKRCLKLEMLLHVSTGTNLQRSHLPLSLPAYVAGEQSGLILEKKFLMGETLMGDSYLDIEAELSLADKKKRDLRAEDATEEAEKLAMKELGIKRFGPCLCSHWVLDLHGHLRATAGVRWLLCRTIDSVLIGYAKGKITCFFGDLDIIVDVVRARGHGGECDDGDHGNSREAAGRVHLPHGLVREKASDVRHRGALCVPLLPYQPSRRERWKCHAAEEASIHQKHGHIPRIHDSEIQTAIGGQSVRTSLHDSATRILMYSPTSLRM
ncbi:hypothetical protein BHE74_00027774 [Ensete ventricosum]|nr:hypothetical protein BHE74_00027774 [Ensete ventricosum]